MYDDIVVFPSLILQQVLQFTPGSDREAVMKITAELIKFYEYSARTPETEAWLCWRVARCYPLPVVASHIIHGNALIFTELVTPDLSQKFIYLTDTIRKH